MNKDEARDFLRNISYNLILELVQDKETDPFILEMFYIEWCDHEIRSAISSNPNTNILLLDKLSRDVYQDVRVNVASNPSTYISTIEDMINDSCLVVQEEIAKRSDITYEMYKKLAKHENNNVVIVLLDNKIKYSDVIKTLYIQNKDNFINEKLEKEYPYVKEQSFFERILRRFL